LDEGNIFCPILGMKDKVCNFFAILVCCERSNGGGRFHLTPLYDVLSAWPIIGPGPNELAEQDVEVAMGVRRTKNLERKLRHISTSHWKALATRTGVPGMFEEMEHLVHRADSAFDHIATTLPADFPESVWHRIRQGVRAQCEKFRIGATAVSNV
jgi:serine/threonine-protein kinase HipA